MTLPNNIPPYYIEVKYFLNSFRALSDARSGIRHLEEYVKERSFLLSEWKVIWIGTCTILRTCIDLFQVDARSCINAAIRKSISEEWHTIKRDKDRHPIFWEFLRKERDMVIHEYNWAAYEAWLTEDGAIVQPSLPLLATRPEDARTILAMRNGIYQGRNSLELLQEGADWVEARILGAIRSAGFDPDERREIRSFRTMTQDGRSLGLVGLLDENPTS